ncbi:hypothetical protein B0T16DRAFT_491818 [Cercophora newfieldiana]|uniref:Uncharacterized protein n=1 Tax=Cercophora newfieldiana TaxID=92897 RepID=A0AA39YBA2_9PEZI|nr:hypothetical protein B0T16DRAFT_491818 [Cercophora newfieldiana]
MQFPSFLASNLPVLRMMANKVHWLGPTSMVTWLLLAVATAIGHHFFYTWLDGRIVQSKTEQEWYGRIGTGLAFLTNALLSAASTIAYTQLLWKTLRSKTVSVGGVDALFGATTSAWNLANLELWRRGPLLGVVAAISWMLPLLAVVTPSTLVVVQSATPNVTITEMPMPIIDHAPEKVAQWSWDRVTEDKIVLSKYNRPATAITRLVANVASSGSILPILAPFPNSSYSLDFYGPSISCVRADPILEQSVTNRTERDSLSYLYIGFVPDPPDSRALNDTTIDILNGVNLTLLSTSTKVSKLQTYDELGTNGHARLFIWTRLPGNYNTTTKVTIGADPPKLMECGLFNSSYKVDFNYTNNRQSISVRNLTRLNGITYSTYLSFNFTTVPEPPGFFEGAIGCALMEALSKMLVGFLRLASVTDGWVSDGELGILNTVLMQAHEVRRLYQKVAQDEFTPFTEPLVIRNMSIAEAIEELSQNITLSLFSNPYFLQNPSANNRSAAAAATVPRMPVTVTTPQNAYSYNNPRNLAIAYGLGIGFAVAAVTAGLVCIHAVEGTFSTSFSTILRTTRGAQLDGLVHPSEMHGKEPLPKRLGRMKVLLGGSNSILRFTKVEGQGREGSVESEVELLKTSPR